MGRHSAPAEDDEEALAVLTVPSVSAGRHSRPAEDEDDARPPLAELQTQQIPVVVATEAAEVDQAATELTERLPVVAEPIPPPAPSPPPGRRPAAPPSPAAAPTTGKRGPRGTHATSADLALLREHPDVRARCIAAVVVPFVLYTAFLLALGSLAVGVYLIWVWIPLVSAGVLAGGFLDAAHRRYGAPPT